MPKESLDQAEKIKHFEVMGIDSERTLFSRVLSRSPNDSGVSPTIPSEGDGNDLVYQTPWNRYLGWSRAKKDNGCFLVRVCVSLPYLSFPLTPAPHAPLFSPKSGLTTYPELRASKRLRVEEG